MRALIFFLALIGFYASSAAQSSDSLALTEWGPENGLGQFIIFTGDEKIKVWGGCNWISGKYAQSQNRLRITDISAPEPTCPDMKGAEAAFTSGLRSVKTYRIEQDALELFNREGRVVLRLFARNPWAVPVRTNTP